MVQFFDSHITYHINKLNN